MTLRRSRKASTRTTELEAETVAGIAELDRGEYIELTREQLDHAATTGEWPWAEDESRG